jgi:hypothetical protein
MPRCVGTKRDGGQCTTIVKPPQTHCYQHDPARAGERKRNASKAARSPAKGRSNSEIREVKAQLEDLYTAVLEGVVGRQDAAVCTQICNTRLRALEVERKLHEHDQLEGRWDELVVMLEEAERRTHVSRR